MAHISISAEDHGSLTAISRDLHEHEDTLEAYMQAFSDFLMAEGFSGDARFVEMQECWADINRDVYEDGDWSVTTDGRSPFADEPEEDASVQLELPLEGAKDSEFRVGDIVKCDIDESKWLKESVGKINVIDGFMVNVQFSNGQLCWFTDGELTLLYRP